MYCCKAYSFVFLFLFVSKTAHAVILLSANVDDIKRIAKKFVSDDLADTIANTVGKMIGNGNLNGNAQQDFNRQEHQIERQLIRTTKRYETSQRAQRFQKATRREEIFERKHGHYDIEVHKQKENLRTTRKEIRNWALPRDHSINANDQKHYQEIRPSRPHIQRLDHSISKRPHYQKKSNQYKNKQKFNKDPSQFVPYLKPIINQDFDNRAMFVESHLQDEKVTKSRQQYPAFVPTHERAQNIYSVKPRKIEPVTSKKHKVEIDQYVNKFVKSLNGDYLEIHDALATSGDIGLTKKPKEQKWWEKEIPETTTQYY